MTDPHCIHCDGELPGFVRVPDPNIAPSSNQRVWLASKGNEKTLRLTEADGWEVHEVTKAPACNSPEDIRQSMDLLQQIHRDSVETSARCAKPDIHHPACNCLERESRDAERYRFIRQPGNAIVYAKDRSAWGNGASGHVRYDTAEQLDAAVDAARAPVKARAPLSEKCPKCGTQMYNWPGAITKCVKCLHEWYMDSSAVNGSDALP